MPCDCHRLGFITSQKCNSCRQDMIFGKRLCSDRIFLPVHDSTVYGLAYSSCIVSPIGLSILRDIEFNMCCTKIPGLDYFSESRNFNMFNLHLLVHKVFLKFRWENEIKQMPSSRYIYWKTVAEVYPFEIRHYSPSRPLASDGQQLVQGDSEFTNFISRQKLYRCD